MAFADFVGHEDAKLALILNAIDFRCGGVLFFGEKGSGKSTLARFFKNILPENIPWAEIPLNVTEDRLLGSIDMNQTIRSNRKVFQPGILSKANGGVVFIDDINLLSPEIVALIFEAQDRGEILVEREGFTLRQPSRFIIVATLNPEEGDISPHLLDRFGMCVIWQGIKDRDQRIELIKRNILIEDHHHVQRSTSDRSLIEKIASSRLSLKTIVLPEPVREYISQLCLELNASGHRGELYLMYAAQAYAAYCGRQIVSREEVDQVSTLVLAHRKRMVQPIEQRADPPEHQPPNASGEQKEEETRPSKEDSTPNSDSGRMSRTESDGFNGSNPQWVESNPKEEIFEIGDPFKIKRMFFKKDRMYRSASGRRTKTRVKDRSGKYVKSGFQPKEDIAIDATIRAAAPHQKVRGRKDQLLIREEDLRFKRREKKMGHLVIFVVDGSGSMAVQKRMTETKGAIFSMLMDCYQKRDQVSLIVFRKQGADVVLPPTKSLLFSFNKLKDLPVGGKTPLTAGLLEGFKLIRRVMVKSPETRFLLVLITDGRANQSMTDQPVREELRKMIDLLHTLRLTDFMVIDTEDKKRMIKTDLALQIASQLKADYYAMENLRSEFLTELIQMKKEELSSKFY